MKCDRELISLYRDGELDSYDRRMMAEHVASCATCRATMRSYERIGSAIRNYDGGPIPADLEARFQARVGVRPPRVAALQGGRLVRLLLVPSLALGTLGSAAVLFLLLGAPFLSPASRQYSVVAAYPPDGAQNVVLERPIEVELSGPLDADSVDWSVNMEPEIAVRATREGNKVLVWPTEPLRPETTYSIKITPKKHARSDATAAPDGPPLTVNFSTGNQLASVPPFPASDVGTPPATIEVQSLPIASRSGTPAPTVMASEPTAVLRSIPRSSATGTAVAIPSSPTVQPEATAIVVMTAPKIATESPALTSASTPCSSRLTASVAGLQSTNAEAVRKLGCPVASEYRAAVSEQLFANGTAVWQTEQRNVIVAMTNGRWVALGASPVTAATASVATTEEGASGTPDVVAATAPASSADGKSDKIGMVASAAESQDALKATPTSPAPPTSTLTAKLERSDLNMVLDEHPDVRATLGSAVAPEVNHTATAQEFANGRFLSLADSSGLVLFRDDGTWLRTSPSALDAAPTTLPSEPVPTATLAAIAPTPPIAPTLTPAGEPTTVATPLASPPAPVAATPTVTATTAVTREAAPTSTPKPPGIGTPGESPEAGKKT